MKAGWFEATVPKVTAAAAAEPLCWRVVLLRAMGSCLLLLLAPPDVTAEPLSVAVIVQPGGASGESSGLSLAGSDSSAVAAARSSRSMLTQETEVTRDPAPSRQRVAALRGDPVALGTPNIAAVEHRWWLERGRADVGLGVGVMGVSGAGGAPWTIPAAAEGPAGVVDPSATMSVGLRYRLSPETRVFADARRLGSPASDGDAAVATRLGIEWKAARRTPMGLDKGSLRFQLRSGSLMSLRIRKGGIGLQLRSQF